MNAGSEKLVTEGNLYLLGFMAAGKSTIGEMLAEKTGREFCDTDKVVEDQAGLSIAEIFQEYGEGRFRELESEAVQRVSRRTRVVVALGGGAVINHENWQAIRNSGTTFYLRWQLSTLLARLEKENKRPLVFGWDDETPAEMKRLFESRKALYERADYTIDCHDELTPALIVDRITTAISCEK